MSDDNLPRRSWAKKFGDAFRGCQVGVRGQSSFLVHFLLAVAVLAAALVLRVGRLELCLLVLCIALVLAAEMFNSALESLARAITDRPHPLVRDALDIASAAVLVTALGAAAVGLLIFLHRAGVLLGWWG